MSAQRPPKGKKAFPDNNNANIGSRGSRGPAWRTSGSQNFANAARQNAQFPPLSGGQQRSETGYDPKLLATLASATGQTIILTLKSQARHEGVVGGTISGGETAGVTLKDCRDLGNPQSPVRESMLFAASDIQSWAPAPARMANGTDSFRTDTDISNSTNTAAPRERELQQWQPEAATNDQANSLSALQGDEATFGPPGGYSGVPWDQFEVNEQLFGVTTKFDEDAYTTKLDRSAPGFKERERKAQQLANEIMGTTTNNPHIAEERVMNGTENGIGEEEKFSAVVRSAGAYVPPGARRNGSGATAAPANGPSNPPPANPQSANPPTSPAPTTTTNGTAPAAQPSGNANNEEGSAKPPAEGLVANFRDFVTSEKARLEKRKQAMVKTEMDKRKADLLKFSKSFRLSKPIPEDLLPILAKTEEKQKAIVDKANADVVASQTKGPTKEAAAGASSKAPNSQESASKSAIKPAPTSDGVSKKPKGSVYIQPIPPFNKDKTRKAGSPPGTTTQAAAGTNTTAPSVQTTPASPTAAKATPGLNANASVFKPNANAAVFKPNSPAATPPPKIKEPIKEAAAPTAPAAPAGPPNPFYGARAPTKKGAVVNIKDDFNPFRHSKVLDASQISSIWPYSGKRFLTLYPNLPMHIPPGPNIPTPQIPGPPPPPYEEDPSAQPNPAQRQIPQQQQPPPQQQQPQYPVMYYPQYPYSPAPHGQPPMMMPPGPPQFMPGPYMHPVAYPHHMPPNTPMYGHPSPAMPGVPPTPHYMPHQPYPQTSPPPTGTPRGPGPMPPQQMPHGYYHPSPQLTHAMPYQMMMPPPQPGPHFDPNAQGPPPVAPQPTQMGH